MSTVIYKEYTAPEINRREILRYMGCKSSTPEAEGLIDRTTELAQGRLTYKACFSEFSIKRTDKAIDLGFSVTESRDLRKCLKDCEKIIVFAATVGLDLDRLILRHSRLSPSVAVCLQAFGAERIEALCDKFCDELKAEYALCGLSITPRFSPGYGDLPLDLQKDIFKSLDCEKRLGLTLNDSLLMSPSKSVTAIMGVY